MSSVSTVGRWFFHMRRILATLCIGVLAVLIAYKVVFGANGTMEWRAKRAEYQRLQSEIDVDNQVHQELETRVKKLQTDRDTIIKEAREKLGYVMPGEFVLVQPQAKSDSRTNTAVAENIPESSPKKK
jgi:cell division protein FtsB